MTILRLSEGSEDSTFALLGALRCHVRSVVTLLERPYREIHREVK